VLDIKGRAITGVSEYISSHFLLRGNVVTGGTQTPEALKQQTTVTSSPPSGDTILLTSILPFSEITLGK
jgi:hypothetical protein